MFFSFITKNSHWEILTKILVTFKRWDGLRTKNCNTYRSSLKNPIFSGERGVHEKPIYKGELPKKRGLDNLQIQRGAGGGGGEGGLAKKGGMVLLRGVDSG